MYQRILSSLGCCAACASSHNCVQYVDTVLCCKRTVGTPDITVLRLIGYSDTYAITHRMCVQTMIRKRQIILIHACDALCHHARTMMPMLASTRMPSNGRSEAPRVRCGDCPAAWHPAARPMSRIYLSGFSFL